MSLMEPSPAGRRIVDLPGDPGTIRTRGNAITTLGDQMGTSAAFLQRLADEASDQRGEAVEKLREIVGDTYEELRRAGEMYRPTGPVLVAYADALTAVQPLVNAAAQECRDAWVTYDTAPGFLPGERPTWGGPEEGTPEAEQNSADDTGKQNKHDDFVEKGHVYDRHVDTWEEAFDTAANSIGDILDGKIEDSPWDDLDGFVGGVLAVLQVVGIIVGIAAIIIGGPIVALIGAVVGVLTLALTLYQYLRGDTGLTQLILAIVGVIPFGSAGKLFQGSAGRIAFLGDMFTAFKPSSWTAAIAQGRSLSLVSSMAGGGLRGLLAGGRGFLTMNNPAGVGDVMTRLLFGKDVAGMSGMIDAMTGGVNGFCNSTTVAAGWQFAYTVLSGSWKLGDNIATWTGNKGSGPSGALPLVGALL